MTDPGCALRSTATNELDGIEPELADSALALYGCNRFEIVIGRYEHESAGLRFETWPDDIRRRIETVLAEWQSRNSGRALRCISTSVTQFACVMVIHHAAKG